MRARALRHASIRRANRYAEQTHRLTPGRLCASAQWPRKVPLCPRDNKVPGARARARRILQKVLRAVFLCSVLCGFSTERREVEGEAGADGKARRAAKSLSTLRAPSHLLTFRSPSSPLSSRRLLSSLQPFRQRLFVVLLFPPPSRPSFSPRPSAASRYSTLRETLLDLSRNKQAR